MTTINRLSFLKVTGVATSTRSSPVSCRCSTRAGAGDRYLPAFPYVGSPYDGYDTPGI